MSLICNNETYPSNIKLYQIQMFIGKGAFGDVWEAKVTIGPHKGESIAIKEVDLEELGDKLVDNLSYEISLMNSLNHPNLIKTLQTCTLGHKIFIIMPLLECGSLSSILNYKYPSGIKDEKIIATIIKIILETLDYLHERNYIHRDIKSGNILIGKDGDVIVGDFGVATKLKKQSKKKSFVGSFCWMPPEVISNEGYDYKFDIWSLGITAIELAQGKPPFFTLGEMDVLRKIQFEDPPNLKDFTKWDPLFINFIKSCLIKNPKNRPSARELLNMHSKYFEKIQDKNYLQLTLLKGVPVLKDRYNKIKHRNFNKNIHKDKLLNNALSTNNNKYINNELTDSIHIIKSNKHRGRKIIKWNFSSMDNCKNLNNNSINITTDINYNNNISYNNKSSKENSNITFNLNNINESEIVEDEEIGEIDTSQLHRTSRIISIKEIDNNSIMLQSPLISNKKNFRPNTILKNSKNKDKFFNLFENSNFNFNSNNNNNNNNYINENVNNMIKFNTNSNYDLINKSCISQKDCRESNYKINCIDNCIKSSNYINKGAIDINKYNLVNKSNSKINLKDYNSNNSTLFLNKLTANNSNLILSTSNISNNSLINNSNNNINSNNLNNTLDIKYDLKSNNKELLRHNKKTISLVEKMSGKPLPKSSITPFKKMNTNIEESLKKSKINNYMDYAYDNNYLNNTNFNTEYNNLDNQYTITFNKFNDISTNTNNNFKKLDKNSNLNNNNNLNLKDINIVGFDSFKQSNNKDNNRNSVIKENGYFETECSPSNKTSCNKTNRYEGIKKCFDPDEDDD